MSKTKVVRVKTWLWDRLQEDALEFYGHDGEELTYLAHILTNDAITNNKIPPKPRSAAKEEKPDLGPPVKRFIYHTGGVTNWIAKEDNELLYNSFFYFMENTSCQGTYSCLFRKNKDYSISEMDIEIATCFEQDYVAYKEATRVRLNRGPSPEVVARRAAQEAVLVQAKIDHEAQMDKMLPKKGDV